MAIKTILGIQDPTLRKVSAEVSTFGSDSLKALVDDLYDTLANDKTGVGLSAIQIGIEKRVFVTLFDGVKRVYINPQWNAAWGAKEVVGKEGCLSDKGNFVDVKRYERIHLSYQDINGRRFTDKLSGLKARCFIHENSHLDGDLFIDHQEPKN